MFKQIKNLKSENINSHLRFWISLRFGICLLIILASACKEKPQQGIATKSTTAKVASLVPAATDLILGMHAGDHLIAISNWDPKLPALDALPRVGDYRTIDWERIGSLHPTHMIVQFAPDKMPAGLDEKAKSLGIMLVNIRIYHLNDIFTSIDQLGEALNEKDKATAARNDLQNQLDAVHARVKNDAPVRTILIRSEGEIATVGGGNFMDDLLTLAGGMNVIE